jgi:regulatory protein
VPATRSGRERREAAEARRAARAAVTDPDVVMAAAAAFLAVRQRSVQETQQRLVQLGYPADLCTSVVGRLIELGYLDDVTFARAWVESRDRARPRGEVALRLELRRKGIADDVIASVLAERASTGTPLPEGEAAHGVDLVAARHLLQRRASTLGRVPDPRRRRQRAYALLARNGFDPDVCRIAASELVGGPDGTPTEGV